MRIAIWNIIESRLNLRFALDPGATRNRKPLSQWCSSVQPECQLFSLEEGREVGWCTWDKTCPLFLVLPGLVPTERDPTSGLCSQRCTAPVAVFIVQGPFLHPTFANHSYGLILGMSYSSFLGALILSYSSRAMWMMGLCRQAGLLMAPIVFCKTKAMAWNWVVIGFQKPI